MGVYRMLIIVRLRLSVFPLSHLFSEHSFKVGMSILFVYSSLRALRRKSITKSVD